MQNLKYFPILDYSQINPLIQIIPGEIWLPQSSPADLKKILSAARHVTPLRLKELF